VTHANQGVSSPFETGAQGGPKRERLQPEDAVCAPLDTMMIRVSCLEREELRNAVNSLLEHAEGGHSWRLYAPPDSPVYAVTRGIVRQLDSWRKELSLAIELCAPPAVRLARSYGARSLFAMYSGLGSASVAIGDEVGAGKIVGRIGGPAPGSLSHLRFELRTSLRRGRVLNPRELLGVPETGMGAACGH
jgi:hypothetical protein